MHSNGTTLSGDLASIWSLIRACVEALHAAGVVRVLTSFVFQTKDASGSEVKASRAIPANLLFATGVISARQLATSAEFDSAVENLARAMAKNAVRTEIHNSNIHVEGDWEAVGQALDCACIESMECHITLQLIRVASFATLRVRFSTAQHSFGTQNAFRCENKFGTRNARA